jgi:hypothetical protein
VHLLQPWARWITPDQEKRRFDTMFYVAVYHGSQQGHFEVQEADDLAWFCPDTIIRQFGAGSLALPPPTFVCLSEFLNYKTLDGVLRASKSGRATTPLQPHIVVDEAGKACILLDDDADHPRFDQPSLSLRPRSRIVLDSMTKFHLDKTPISKL